MKKISLLEKIKEVRFAEELLDFLDDLTNIKAIDKGWLQFQLEDGFAYLVDCKDDEYFFKIDENIFSLPTGSELIDC